MRRAVLAGIGASLIAGLVVQPFPPFARFVVGQLALLVIVTVGLNFLIGVGGLLSIASAAFLGIGAYGLTIGMANVGMPFWLAIPLIVVLAWCLGWLLGVLSLRLVGFHLAIVTLGFLQVFVIVLRQGGDFTGGGYGLTVPYPTLLGAQISESILVGLTVVFAGLACTFTYTLTRSRIGRALEALKSHPAAASLQGIDPRRLKTLAFAYSSALAALAGTMQAIAFGSVHPASYGVNEAVWHLAIVVVGGLQGSVSGAVLATTLLFILPELIRPLASIRDYFTGAILLLTLALAPNGLGGAIQGTWRRLQGLSGRRGVDAR